MEEREAAPAGSAPATTVDAQPSGLPTANPQTTPVEDTWERDWGLFLRLARQVAGLSLTELAARSGLSKGYLSKLESGATGARNPSRATLAALARALPSFRALAHVLDPGLAPMPLAPTHPSTGTTRIEPNGAGESAAQAEVEPQPPLRLGWRELEVILAVLALDSAALPIPLTPSVLGRALRRSPAEIVPAVNQLVSEGVLVCSESARPGGLATYRPSDDLPRRLGISRVGDGLILAAALLASAGAQTSRAPNTNRPT